MGIVTDARFTPATRDDARGGLLGWVRFQIDASWAADGVAVRRTRRGRLTLSFPARLDARGREHPYLRPTCDRARRAIEREVFALLGLPDEERDQRPRPLARDGRRNAVSHHERVDASLELGGGDGHGRKRTRRRGTR